MIQWQPRRSWEVLTQSKKNIDKKLGKSSNTGKKLPLMFQILLFGLDIFVDFLSKVVLTKFLVENITSEESEKQ